MTQDQIRRYFAADPAVRIQIACAEDGSPQLAWGDSFCFVVDDQGRKKKMPFATIVTKDYPGFDEPRNSIAAGASGSTSIWARTVSASCSASPRASSPRTATASTSAKPTACFRIRLMARTAGLR